MAGAIRKPRPSPKKEGRVSKPKLPSKEVSCGKFIKDFRAWQKLSYSDTRVTDAMLLNELDILIRCGHARFGAPKTHQANRLLVPHAAVEIQGVVFGPFEVAFNFGVASRDYHVVTVHTLNEEHAKIGATHPHVSDDILCAGTVASRLREALDLGALVLASELVAGVLQSYSPSNAHWSIANMPVLCAECKRRTWNDEIEECACCHAKVCPNCAAFAEDNDLPPLCEKCSEVCDACNRSVPKVLLIKRKEKSRVTHKCPTCVQTLQLIHGDKS